MSFKNKVANFLKPGSAGPGRGSNPRGTSGRFEDISEEEENNDNLYTQKQLDKMKKEAYFKKLGEKEAVFKIEMERAKFNREEAARKEYGPQSFKLFGQDITNIARVGRQAEALRAQQELRRLKSQVQQGQLQRLNQQYQQPQSTIGGGQSGYTQTPPQPGLQSPMGFRDPFMLPNANLSLPSLGFEPQAGQPSGLTPYQGQDSFVQSNNYAQQGVPSTPAEEPLFRKVREKYGYKAVLWRGEELRPGESLFRRTKTAYGYKFTKAR